MNTEVREFSQEVTFLLRPCEVGAVPEAELGGREVLRLERGWVSKKAPENRKTGKARSRFQGPGDLQKEPRDPGGLSTQACSSQDGFSHAQSACPLLWALAPH